MAGLGVKGLSRKIAIKITSEENKECENMGPLQDSDHMVQIRHTGTQIAHWDI